MAAYAAVSTTCVDQCEAITCILRQCVHNKDNYNEDDHTGERAEAGGKEKKEPE